MVVVLKCLNIENQTLRKIKKGSEFNVLIASFYRFSSSLCNTRLKLFAIIRTETKITSISNKKKSKVQSLTT